MRLVIFSYSFEFLGFYDFCLQFYFSAVTLVFLLGIESEICVNLVSRWERIKREKVTLTLGKKGKGKGNNQTEKLT